MSCISLWISQRIHRRLQVIPNRKIQGTCTSEASDFGPKVMSSVSFQELLKIIHVVDERLPKERNWGGEIFCVM